MLVTIAACKSGSGMQTANKHVRDVVAMSGKAGSEGIARASGLLLAEKYSRRRCKQEKEMGDFHPVHLRGCDCDLLRPIHGTTSAFCWLPSTAGWVRFNRETPYSPRCDCEQPPPQMRFPQRKSHPVGYTTLTSKGELLNRLFGRGSQAPTPWSDRARFTHYGGRPKGPSCRGGSGGRPPARKTN